jgi:hypothetical protein
MMASSLTLLPSWRHHFGDVTWLAHLAMALFCGMLAALGVVYGLGGSVVHLVILLAFGEARTCPLGCGLSLLSDVGVPTSVVLSLSVLTLCGGSSTSLARLSGRGVWFSFGYPSINWAVDGFWVRFPI